MNKNTKKFVVTLLSVLMVLSFMPAMAFAATPSGEFNAAHEWDTDPDNEVEIVAPTCTSPGIVEVKCVRDGGICNATSYKATAELGHEWVSTRFDNAAEFAAALINNGVAKATVDAWLAGKGANVCYGYADVCSVCGALKVTDPGLDGLYGLTATEHKEPAKTKACAASFTCDLCGKEAATNSTHNKTTAANYHKKTSGHLTPSTVAGQYCTATYYFGGPQGKDHHCNIWAEITAYTCNECKQVVLREQTVKNDGTGANEPKGKDAPTMDDLNHNMKQTIVKEPTCAEPGEKANVCEDCGYVGPTTNIQPLAHDYSVVNSVPATTTSPAYTYKSCKYCNTIDPDSYEYTGKPLSSKEAYTFESLRDKTCDQGGLIKVTWTKENTSLVETGYLTYDHTTGDYAWFGEPWFPVFTYKTDKDYFKGFWNELSNADAIEIPDIKDTGHKWAKSAKVADATCTIPEQEAMTCTICGCIKHPTTKIGKALGHEVEEVVVAPTCGTAGYTYKICTRCHSYLTADGKYETLFPRRYNETDPVVKLGAECKFDTWKVIKEATADEDGSKILTCGTCGAELAGSETVIPADTDAKKDQEIEKATPVIAAAATITADKYTADSAKAVAEAKAALNQAIASGTAADVTRATAALQKAVDEAVEKAANPMVAKAKTVKAKANKKTTIKAKKAFTVKKAQGKVTYAKKSGNGKITVSKAGKVTVKKGLKAGKTYKVKVQIKAAGNGNYLAKTKTVTLKVKVK